MTNRTPGFAVLALLPMAMVVGARLVGPDDLDTNDQAKQALYVLDICQHDRWVLPLEHGTEPATKPPLYAWMAAGLSIGTGQLTELTCRMPSALAALVAAFLIFRLGRERWDAATGCLASWVFAGMHTVAKLAIHVRPDMVLTAFVVGCFYALHQLEQGRPRGARALFWTCLSFSILAKGPPGPIVVLGACAALACSRRWRGCVGQILCSWWASMLLLPLAWFLGACILGGERYLTGTVLREVVERALASGSREGKGEPFGRLFLLFLGRCAPWSAVGLVGGAAVLLGKAPARSREAWRLAAAWAFAGLLIFSISRGQREDYLLPLLPGCALLVAGVLTESHFAWFPSAWRWCRMAATVVCFLLALSLSSGIPDGFPQWDEIAEVGGATWTGALAAASCLFLVSLLLEARGRRELRPAPAATLASAAVLVVLLGYYVTISPDARSREGEDTRSFARAVSLRIAPEEGVHFLGVVGNAVRFYLQRDEPALPTHGVVEKLERQQAGQRFLLLTTRLGEEALPARVSDRLQPLLRHPRGVSRGEFVLLEAAEPGSTRG